MHKVISIHFQHLWFRLFFSLTSIDSNQREILIRKKGASHKNVSRYWLINILKRSEPGPN